MDSLPTDSCPHFALCQLQALAPIKSKSNTHVQPPLKHVHFPSAFLQKIVFELEGSSGYKPSNAPSSSRVLHAGRIACRQLISLWMGSETLSRPCFQEREGALWWRSPCGDCPEPRATLLAEQQLTDHAERPRAEGMGAWIPKYPLCFRTEVKRSAVLSRAWQAKGEQNTHMPQGLISSTWSREENSTWPWVFGLPVATELS